jgi:PPOX class F420-dependent enzyme/OxyR family protein
MPDTMFSQKETEYLSSQRLARIATASSREGSIQPDVVPVGFDFDGEYFYVSGMNLLKSTKYKNVQKNPRVALVVDDLKSVNPWEPYFYSLSSKGNDLQSPGWNLSCMYFHMCGSKSICTNFFLNEGCMPK